MWAGIETGNPDLFSLAMRFSPTGRRGTPWEIAASVGAGVRANPADPERVCRAGVDQARSSHDGAVEPAGLEHLEVPARVVEHLRREGHQQEANDAVGHARASCSSAGSPPPDREMMRVICSRCIASTMFLVPSACTVGEEPFT